jgi:hypothetical protein
MRKRHRTSTERLLTQKALVLHDAAETRVAIA